MCHLKFHHGVSWHVEVWAETGCGITGCTGKQITLQQSLYFKYLTKLLLIWKCDSYLLRFTSFHIFYLNRLRGKQRGGPLPSLYPRCVV